MATAILIATISTALALTISVVAQCLANRAADEAAIEKRLQRVRA
jgi:hypothetical protein